MHTTRRRLARACVIVLTTVCATASAAAAEWKPERNVEWVVPTGPGSGVDNTARTLQMIMQTAKLVDAPMSVINKAGGSYGVALNYLAQFNGDGQRLMIQTSTPLSALLTGQINADYFAFTPLANLITEPIAFMVRADSPITSGRDLAARIKADPGTVSIALAAARGNAYHIAAALIARSVGADSRKLKIVVFGSSADAMTALMGGHVDVASATPGAFLQLLETKKIRIAGIASPRRLHGPLAAVATLKEQGVDVVFDVPRSVIGPKGLSNDQVKYWDGVFQRVIKTPAWKDALEKNQWDEDYMNGAELGKYLKSQHTILKDVLGELGMLKQ